MRKRMKRYRLLLPILAAVVLALAACAPAEESVEPGETVFVEYELTAGEMGEWATMIGSADEALVAARGNGTAQHGEAGERAALSARVYEDTLFGIRGELAFVFGDDGTVNAVLFSFRDANVHDVIDLISLELGDAEEVTEQGGVIHARWQNEGYLYALTGESAALYLEICES